MALSKTPRNLFVVGVVLGAICTLSGVQAKVEMQDCDIQMTSMPTKVIPREYSLLLRLNSTRSTYEGDLDIYVDVTKGLSKNDPSFKIRRRKIDDDFHAKLVKSHFNRKKQVVLHASSTIEINDVNFSEFGLKGQIETNKVVDICRDMGRSMILITFARPFRAKTRGKLNFKFSKRINGGGSGSVIYKVYSENSEAVVSKFIVGKQRLIFPSFDDSKFSPNMRLTLVTDEGDGVGAETPLKAQSVYYSDGQEFAQFEFDRYTSDPKRPFWFASSASESILARLVTQMRKLNEHRELIF